MPSKSNAAEVIAASSAAKEEIVRRKDEDVLAALKQFGEIQGLDWKKLPPPVVAMILTKIPRKGKVNEPDWYMTPIHALVYAMRCYELDISPWSISEAFPMREDFNAHLTTEGKRRIARQQGMNFGPPQFEWVYRDWVGAPILGKDNKPVSVREPGLVGKMSVVVNNGTEYATFTAWLSEWHTGHGQWPVRWAYMLQVRCSEKLLTFASGAGISAIPDEREIEQEQPPELPDVQVPKMLKAPEPFLNPPKEQAIDG